MAEARILLLVKFKSKLGIEDVKKVAENRADEFRALAGLKQKYYFQDPNSGEFGGLYLWDSPESLNEYRNSELRKSIAAAYQTEGEPRVEVFQVLMPLRDKPL